MVRKSEALPGRPILGAHGGRPHGRWGSAKKAGAGQPDHFPAGGALFSTTRIPSKRAPAFSTAWLKAGL